MAAANRQAERKSDTGNITISVHPGGFPIMDFQLAQTQASRSLKRGATSVSEEAYGLRYCFHHYLDILALSELLPSVQSKRNIAICSIQLQGLDQDRCRLHFWHIDVFHWNNPRIFETLRAILRISHQTIHPKLLRNPPRKQ